MKILSIDFGVKKIGLAISDPAEKIAFPLEVIENQVFEKSDFVWLSLAQIIRQEEIAKIVVGLPVYQKNKDKPEIYNQVLKFIAELKNHFPKIAIDTQDELLSSQTAQNLTKQKNRHDLAAMVILEDYLEKAKTKY